MSNQAMWHALQRSPFKGSTLLVHLCLADSANDQNGNEIWMSTASIAAKARVSRRTAQSALDELVERKFLKVVREGGAGPRSTTCYQLLMPDSEVVWEGAKSAPLAEPKGANSDRVRAQSATDKGADSAPEPKKSNPREQPNGENARAIALFSTDPEPDSFDHFWSLYPKRRAKQAAKAAFVKAVKSNQAAPATICVGAERLRDFVAAGHQKMEYVPYPATWLNDGGWDDELVVPDESAQAYRRSEPKGLAGLRAAAAERGLTK